MAFRNANYLVGNEETEAVLEVTLFGGTLEFTEDTITAITGADMEPVVDGDPVEMNCPLLIRKGQILTLGMTRQGCRTYLAFAGGIDVPLVMGSRSTNLKCAFGGYGAVSYTHLEEDYITQNRMIEEAVADGTDVIVFSAIDYEGNAVQIPEYTRRSVLLPRSILYNMSSQLQRHTTCPEYEA